jgi:hypothetical protein
MEAPMWVKAMLWILANQQLKSRQGLHNSTVIYVILEQLSSHQEAGVQTPVQEYQWAERNNEVVIFPEVGVMQIMPHLVLDHNALQTHRVPLFKCHIHRLRH